jgi:hypothetical protein
MIVSHLGRWIKEPDQDLPNLWARIWEATWRPDAPLSLRATEGALLFSHHALKEPSPEVGAASGSEVGVRECPWQEAALHADSSPARPGSLAPPLEADKAPELRATLECEGCRRRRPVSRGDNVSLAPERETFCLHPTPISEAVGHDTEARARRRKSPRPKGLATDGGRERGRGTVRARPLYWSRRRAGRRCRWAWTRPGPRRKRASRKRCRSEHSPRRERNGRS